MQVLDCISLSSKTYAPFSESAFPYHCLPSPTCRYDTPACIHPHTTDGARFSRASPDKGILEYAWRCPWCLWYPHSESAEDTNGSAFSMIPLPSTHVAHGLGFCGLLKRVPQSAKPASIAPYLPVFCCRVGCEQNTMGLEFVRHHIYVAGPRATCPLSDISNL
jgi:hypothetical protein